jgi:hypothetical protein
MTFVPALIGAAVGIGSSLMGSSAANGQARRQEANARKAAKEQHKFDVEQYDLANKVANLQWEWDKARVNQLREVEGQKAIDQANYGSMVIANATKNLQINQDALRDRFITEERLRAEQAGMEYGNAQMKMESDYRYQSTQNAIDQLEQSRQFLTQFNLLASQSNSTLKKYENDAADLMASLTLDEARDSLGYQLQRIAAMEQDGRIAAVASAQQGGGVTAQRLAINAAQAAGRTYGELAQKSQGRELKVAMLNTTMKDSVNGELARLALQSQDQIDRGDYSSLKAQRDQAYLSSSYQRESANQANIFDRLTIPTFDLGQKQYGRELQSLQIQTEGKLYEATMAYRQAPYLDPLQPVPGVRPRLTTVGSAAGTSTFGAIGSAIVQGFSSANSWQQAATGKGLFG